MMFHHFATLLVEYAATKPETRQTLLTNTLFKLHAMIDPPLDHNFHFYHNHIVLTGNN